MSETLTQRLTDDMKAAMRSNDNVRRDVLRYLRSAVKNEEIEMKHPATDDEVVDVIQRQIKQRRDSIQAYQEGGRADLAETEQKELEILEEYLPDDQKPLDEDALVELVKEKADELDVSGPADMKVLMPALIDATSGRADNRLLSRLAADELKKRASSG